MAKIKMEVPYFQIPNDIFECGLSRSELIVYFYLARCSNQGSKAFPSYNKIAEKCSMSRPTAIEVVKRLEKYWLLKKKNRQNRAKNENYSNLYIVEHNIPVEKILKVKEREKQEKEREKREKARLRQIGRTFIEACQTQGANPEITPELEEDTGRELEEASAKVKEKKKKWAYAEVE
jgi:hypothetical protein